MAKLKEYVVLHFNERTSVWEFVDTVPAGTSQNAVQSVCEEPGRHVAIPVVVWEEGMEMVVETKALEVDSDWKTQAVV